MSLWLSGGGKTIGRLLVNWVIAINPDLNSFDDLIVGWNQII